MKQALILFTRPPLPGNTKTRLMPLLGPEGCAAFHTAMLRDLAVLLGDYPADLFVSRAPEGDECALREIFPSAVDFILQQGPELGERMEQALCHCLNLGYEAAVLIGSDLPTLSRRHLDEAFTALRGCEATLGPSEDGGYYLVGLRRPCPALFANKSYGSGNVYEQAAESIASAGLSFHAAPSCADVDTAEDLRALWPELEPESHTAAFLHSFFGGDSHGL